MNHKYTYIRYKQPARFSILNHWLSTSIGVMFYIFALNTYASISSPPISISGSYTVNWTDQGQSVSCNSKHDHRRAYAVTLIEKRSGNIISKKGFYDDDNVFSYHFKHRIPGPYTYQLIIRKCGPKGEYNYYSNTTLTKVGQYNIPPVANAGDDITLTEDTNFVLSGSGNDLDGTVVGYSWRQVQGKKVQLKDPNTAKAHFTAPRVDQAYEMLSFVLTVTDDKGSTGQDRIFIKVEKAVTSQIHFVHTDLLGSPTTETDENGNVL